MTEKYFQLQDEITNKLKCHFGIQKLINQSTDEENTKKLIYSDCNLVYEIIRLQKLQTSIRKTNKLFKGKINNYLLLKNLQNSEFIQVKIPRFFDEEDDEIKKRILDDINNYEIKPNKEKFSISFSVETKDLCVEI